jgi:hypothetical protein
MNLLQKKERSQNAEWWSKNESNFIDIYTAIYANKNLTTALKQFGYFQCCAETYIGQSFGNGSC